MLSVSELGALLKDLGENTEHAETWMERLDPDQRGVGSGLRSGLGSGSSHSPLYVLFWSIGLFKEGFIISTFQSSNVFNFANATPTGEFAVLVPASQLAGYRLAACSVSLPAGRLTGCLAALPFGS